MDPLIQGVISGVIANGITPVVFHIGRKDRKILKHIEDLRQLLEKDISLATILQKATASVAKTLEFGDERQVEKLRSFLVSPDVDAIVRQIYASQLTSDKNGKHLESIRAEFLACLSLRLGKPQQSLEALAGQIFDALLKGGVSEHWRSLSTRVSSPRTKRSQLPVTA